MRVVRVHFAYQVRTARKCVLTAREISLSEALLHDSVQDLDRWVLTGKSVRDPFGAIRRTGVHDENMAFLDGTREFLVGCYHKRLNVRNFVISYMWEEQARRSGPEKAQASSS